MVNFFSIPMLQLGYLILLTFILLNPILLKADDDGLVILIDSGIKQNIRDSLGSVTLIDKEAIERQQINDMETLFSKVPGLSAVSSGGYGSNISLYMRGTNTNQTLVLIDGQRMASATTGTSALQFLDTEQIQRVEVVRGAKASLYGADAIGGVINIITRAESDEQNLLISAGGGSFHTQKYGLGINKNIFPSTHVQLNLLYMKSDGFDFTQEKSFKNDDKDGFDNTGIVANIEQKLADWGTLTLGYLGNKGENEYDNVFSTEPTRPYNQFSLDSYQMVLEAQPIDYWHIKLRLGQLIDCGNNKDRLFKRNEKFETKRNSAYWQNDIIWLNQQITTVAVDYYQDKVLGADFVDLRGKRINDRDNLAYLVQHQASFSIHDIQLSLRQDDNQDYGKNTTGNASWAVNFDSLKMVLSYATGFRAPTFNDLYYPGFGNPNLKSEKSDQVEIDFRGQVNTVHWQVNAYHNHMTDMIINIPVTAEMDRPENVGEARITGLELIMSGSIKSIDWQAYYSFIDPMDKSKDRLLPYRAKHYGNIDLSTAFNGGNFGVSLLARGKSFNYDYSGKAYKMGGYATLDLFAAFNLLDNLTCKVKITNVLDKDYAVNQYYHDGQMQYYQTAGIAGFASLVYRMSL